MRLIDADAFNDWMLSHFAEPQSALILTLQGFIAEQPTAYSIDKVVKELESFAKLAEDRWTNGTSKHAYQEHKCWVKAIEIVKQGGVGKDVSK